MRHTAASFVKVDVNALQLLLCVRATVLPLRIDPMLLGYRLPELDGGSGDGANSSTYIRRQQSATVMMGTHIGFRHKSTWHAVI
jgi:hypothetical protein